jgi:hypothetical protein
LSSLRWTILVLGPLPIVAASYALSHWARRGGENLSLEGNHVLDAPEASNRAEGAVDRPAAGRTDRNLAAACELAAADLAEQLGEECAVVAQPPFVLAGDLSPEDLEAWRQRTIEPAARAMAASYFRTPPDRPITVLLFANEASYRQWASALFGDEDVSVYGYYKPGRRTLVMNIATGGGTLVHELTHAMVDFDFPAVPDWFNEGLASLHEQCRFRPDGRGIDGLVNWRLPALQETIRQGRLRSLRRLIGDDDFRGQDVGLNYAQARYFCLFLQERNLLEDFYRRLRSNRADDPLGLATVGEVFPELSWEQLDTDFQAWALELEADP